MSRKYVVMVMNVLRADDEVLAVGCACRVQVSVLSELAGLMKGELEGVPESITASGSVKLEDCDPP